MSRIPAAVLALILTRSGDLCEVCGRRAESTHHRKPRGMGGSKDPAAHSAANLLRVCGDGTRGCHGMIESNRTASYENGRLVCQGDSPADVPVGLRHGWVLLTEDGWHVPAGTADGGKADMTDTSVTRARAALLAALGDTERDWEREPRLLDLYTLLVLIKGTECSAEDVHDAWAVARQRERPGHPALVPFSLLDDSAAKLDIPYRDEIRSAARQWGGVS